MKDIFVSARELTEQTEYADKVRTVLSVRYPGEKPRAFVQTYGCQGNVSDSERLKGQLVQMGYALTDSLNGADLILYNTCAVRGHAEDRVLGNVGELKRLKEKDPQLVIILCGCMTQQTHIAEKLKRSYPYVDLVFGTQSVHRLPELLSKVLCTGKRVFETGQGGDVIAEGLPVVRDGKPDASGEPENAWLPIMYGCDNFCSYCVVPLVRGRERSRKPADVLREANELARQGYRKITLLGQNVNSYGKGLEENIDFSALLRDLDKLEGSFTYDFMTSHPKDCSQRLLDTLAASKRFCGHQHLPVQAGSDRILREMNRGYTRARYLELAAYARRVMPQLSLTTDILVAFPSETYDEFRETLSLIEEVRFDAMFTFIFSPRRGTKAYTMDDPVSKEEKTKWFMELLAVQERIQKEKQDDKSERVC